MLKLYGKGLFIMVVLGTLMCPFDIIAQGHNYEFFLSMTSTGGGGGTKLRWDTRSDWVKSISFELGGVRGAKEFTVVDYYYGYPYKINQTRYVVLTPLLFGLSHTIFKDAIENNVRPFIIGEAGPVFGARFPVGFGLTGNIKRGHTGLTLGGFAGAGLEIGSGKTNVFCITVGYRIATFFKKLGGENFGEKRFNAFLVRFGIVTSFKQIFGITKKYGQFVCN